MPVRRFSTYLLALALTTAPVFAQDANGTGTGVNYETRLSGIETEMRSLNGRVEQVEFAVRRIDQSLQRMQSDNDARLTRLENVASAAQAQAQTQAVAQQPAPPLTIITTPTVPQATQPVAAPSDIPVDGTLGSVKLRNGQVTGAVNNPQSPPLPQVPADYGLTPQEQYDKAFAQLRQADYDGAEKSFKAFIDKNPKDKLLDNAKYWYGETLYVRGRFDDAAMAFADAYQQNMQGGKAPDSLLKLSMSLAALEKTADACTTLAELKSKFPNASSSVKARAQEVRVKLSCGKT